MSSSSRRSSRPLLIALSAILAGCSTGTPSPLTVSAGYANRHVSSASATETVLYRFGGHQPDGVRPQAGLIRADGTLYGVTGQSIVNSKVNGREGAFFSITPAGAETALHLFRRNQGGYLPANLIFGSNLEGNGKAFYGAAFLGGGDGDGTVFEVTKLGRVILLHTFTGPDGDQPIDGLLDLNGTLYGTTYYGGANACGTVFSIPLLLAPPSAVVPYSVSLSSIRLPLGTAPSVPLLNCKWHSPYPTAWLLYGTTFGSVGINDGKVFSVTRAGVETTLYNFKGGRDGANPGDSLVAIGGTLYGTTQIGGGYGCGANLSCGTVFSFTPPLTHH